MFFVGGSNSSQPTQPREIGFSRGAIDDGAASVVFQMIAATAHYFLKSILVKHAKGCRGRAQGSLFRRGSYSGFAFDTFPVGIAVGIPVPVAVSVPIAAAVPVATTVSVAAAVPVAATVTIATTVPISAAVAAAISITAARG